MRKFNGYADEAVKRGIKIYHLNIGQPDIKTPDAYFKSLSSRTLPPPAFPHLSTRSAIITTISA